MITIDVTGTIATSASGTVANGVTVTAPMPDPDPTNNTATVEASITPVAPPEKPQTLLVTGSSDAPWPALLVVAAGAAWLSRRRTR